MIPTTNPTTPTTPTTRKRLTRRKPVLAAIGLVAVAAAATGGALSAAADGGDRRHRNVEVDIAENGTRFVFDAAPVFDDGFPAYGNPFLTQGYIYPAGTLSDSNGVNADGSPEFPDKVIGEWSCRGYFIADGPTRPRAPGCSPPSCSRSVTTPTPEPRRLSSPVTRVARSARS